MLKDIYRYDIKAAVWTSLNPTESKPFWLSTYIFGSSYALSPYGVVVYGGYKFNASSLAGKSFVEDLYAVDIVTKRKRKLSNQSLLIEASPQSRYSSNIAYISLNQVNRISKIDPALLCSQFNTNSKINGLGSISDSIVLFGGSSGSSGTLVDGSSGALLNDMWMLRLVNFSTNSSKTFQQEYINQNCVLYQNISSFTCFDFQNHSRCSYSDLIRIVWCELFSSFTLY
jgi:hypothetical protein